MLRHRQASSQPRLWLLCGAAFLAGGLCSLLLLGGSGSPGDRQPPVDVLALGQAAQAGLNDPPRKRLLAIVGVQTGFNRPSAPTAYNYRLRREALRKTWFPPSQAAADAAERETGMLFRFVVGHSEDRAQEAEMNAEIAENGAFLRLPVQEAYLSLTTKTLVFLREVTRQSDADYIVKVDDDVFMRTDRLPLAIRQWKSFGADYIGCMKNGQVMRDKRLRWYEPQHDLIGGEVYFTHAWGSIYVLSGHAARLLATVSAAVPSGLRFFNNEDVTVGGWMLAMNVTHLDDRRLCDEKCGPASVAVYDIPQCAGLCDAPKKLPQLFAAAECNTPAADPATGQLPVLQPYFHFRRKEQPLED